MLQDRRKAISGGLNFFDREGIEFIIAGIFSEPFLEVKYNNKNMPQEDILSLDPETFDHNKEKGWRLFVESPENMIQFSSTGGGYILGFKQAIFVIEEYLKHFSSKNYKHDIIRKRNILFHLGQQYAYIGDYKNALICMNILKHEGSTNHGKEYLDATIAFLKRDKKQLQFIWKGSNNIVNCTDKQFIDDLYKNYDLTYAEAYSGMSFGDMHKYFLQQQTDKELNVDNSLNG